ncbi:hypothetical protein [Micromonospora sp. NPDC005710]|uniref:hypothetical protein n=1 Tax=Micromonospora sp. NPDC005710 TaxID=3157051 RepID=UPI0033DE4097
MANGRGRFGGRYLMRLLGGVAVIFGILMLFSALTRGDLFGLGLGVVLVGGGAFLLKRSGRTDGAREVAATRTS